MRTRAPIALVLAWLLMAGCGGGSSSHSDEVPDQVPGGADPEAAQVIKGWADDLRAGDIEAAADRFKEPSVVQNGTAPIELRTRDEVISFNESLPCGAKLTQAEDHGRYTIATFELTERPGPGQCGPGTGSMAMTAFLIENGRIAQWRRVTDAEENAPPVTGPVV